MERLTKSEYYDWLMHPTTKAVRKLLSKKVAQLKDMWADGAWEHQETRDAFNRGFISGMMFIEQLDSELEGD